jgi:hypothetical protein
MRLVRHQHYARAVRHVRVVRDVEEDQLVAENAVPDPLVEDRHERLVVHAGTRGVELHAHALETLASGAHAGFPSAAVTAALPPGGDCVCSRRA